MPSITSSSSYLKYYVAVTFAVIGWGLSTSFVEFGLSYINAYLFLALRFSLALIIVIPVIIMKKGPEILVVMKSPWPYIIAFCETTGLIFQYIGQNLHVSAGLSSLLTMMFILIVPTLSSTLLHEKFYRNHAIAIILGFIGLLFIISEGDISRLVTSSTSIVGIILLLFSATSYAFYQITTSKYTREVNRQADSIALFYVVMAMITGFSWVLAYLNSAITFSVPLDGWFWVVMLAIFSTVVAFIGYFEASKGIPVNTLAILLMTQMLVPFFIDIFFLHIVYSLWVYSGAAIIVLGMYFVSKIPLEEDSDNSLRKTIDQSDKMFSPSSKPEILK